MGKIIYYTTIKEDKKDGGYIVTFKDFPEAITQGNNILESLQNASDCLEEAIFNRIKIGKPLPKKPSRKTSKFQHEVSVFIYTKNTFTIP